MGYPELGIEVPTDYVLAIDRTGSTGNIITGGTESIFDVERSAAQKIIETLKDGDRIAIVAFDDEANTMLPLTPCDGTGKVQAGNAIWNTRIPNRMHGTDFACGLNETASLLVADPQRKRAVIFLTDGRNGGGADPVTIVGRIQDSGAMFYAGGIGVDNEGEKLLDEMAGINFKSLTTAEDVSEFFAGAQAQAALAAVTNAQLKVTPVNFAEVLNFELVTRGGAVNYIPSDASGKLINLGEIGVGDTLNSYLGLQVVLPENIAAGRRAFGKLELFGDVPSQGINNQLLASTPIAVQFSDQAVPGTNAEVKNMINNAATARELFKAGQAANVNEMKKHLDEARRTAAFSNDQVANALRQKMGEIDAQVQADPEQAQKNARRATKGFSGAEAAAALRNMNKQS